MEKNVAVAAHSPLLRKALSDLIRKHLGEGISITSLQDRDALLSSTDQPFDLILFIYDTASGFGLDTVQQLQLGEDPVPVVVLNLFPSDHEALTLIQTELKGYLGHRSTPEQFVEALQAVLAGGRYVSPKVAEELVFRMGNSDEVTRPDDLSARESQVLTLIARGKKRAEIAELLHLSPQTVSSYRGRILKKLGLDTNADLIRYAVDHHLV